MHEPFLTEDSDRASESTKCLSLTSPVVEVLEFEHPGPFHFRSPK